MADCFVGPVMDKIIDACSEYLQDKYRWQTEMKEELERLRENHPKVQAVVSAYTPAEFTDPNPALSNWIWKLRDAIDEANDVLDDLEYMKIEEQVIRNKKLLKVRSIMSFLKKIGKRPLKMDPNLKRLVKVVKKLDEVSAEVSTFLPFLRYSRKKQRLQLCKDRETGCLPKNVLIGRDKEKDFVMQWLRKPTTSEDHTYSFSFLSYKNISLLSLVGHDGMGKTVLLQHIYEDLKDEFQLRMWVCVSYDFDAKKIIADMLECLNNERVHSDLLYVLQVSLEKAVRSKRFLLVLDDVREEDISKLGNVFCALVYGGLGSKILLTTRMDSVASAIENVFLKDIDIFKINGLEENACLELLNTHAFVGVENLDSHRNLTDIASSMAKKLSGCPLAAKVIGGVLNSNLNERFWTTFLNSDVLK